MKSKILFIILVSITLLGIIVFWYLPNTYWSPSWQYGLREQERHRRAEEFKNSSVENLIVHIDSSRDWNEFKGQRRNAKYVEHEEAIKALGSRRDEKALAKLRQIILTFPEGQKCDAITSIGQAKNEVMVPILCEALKKHTLSYTDDVIVKALVNINNPVALNCFIQEKNKVLSKKSREAIEKAIEKWSKEK